MRVVTRAAFITVNLHLHQHFFVQCVLPPASPILRLEWLLSCDTATQRVLDNR